MLLFYYYANDSIVLPWIDFPATVAIQFWYCDIFSAHLPIDVLYLHYCLCVLDVLSVHNLFTFGI